jgi:isocitrate dehydrogenase (NAD+)
MAYEVTLITGDGIGPEVAEVTKKCINATGVEINWDEQETGVDALEKHGTPLPSETMESIRRTKCALKAPVTTPVGTGFRSVNVYLRQEFGLFACVRPCKLFQGVRAPLKETNIDFVVIRENSEDLYAGIELDHGSKELIELGETLNRLSTKRPVRTPWGETGISIKPISISATERISRFAFEYAKKNNRKKVTCVHKANIMKCTDGLFLEVFNRVAQNYPDIESEDRIVDNMCMQLVQKPELYDVLVLPNLYGDIVSDLAAGMIGGLGLAPGMNTGSDIAIFEATHGSAPKYKGLNKVNPTGLILSGVLMLRHLREEDAANRLESAVADVIKEGKSVTYDLKENRDDPTAVGTKEMGEEICKKLEFVRV